MSMNMMAASLRCSFSTWWCLPLAEVLCRSRHGTSFLRHARGVPVALPAYNSRRIAPGSVRGSRIGETRQRLAAARQGADVAGQQRGAGRVRPDGLERPHQEAAGEACGEKVE